MSAPTVVVTGAAGFLGGHLVRTLAARGWTVRALVRNPAAVAFPPAVRVARLDLPDVIDEASLAGAMRSCTPRGRSAKRIPHARRIRTWRARSGSSKRRAAPA
jgi:NAD(P)-dependent dehydrogenase (short-subunit alcohol dehydrogenase family)